MKRFIICLLILAALSGVAFASPDQTDQCLLRLTPYVDIVNDAGLYPSVMLAQEILDRLRHAAVSQALVQLGGHARARGFQTLLAAHIEPGDELNWCHVGDLGHIAHKLHEVEAFLKNEDVA